MILAEVQIYAAQDYQLSCFWKDGEDQDQICSIQMCKAEWKGVRPDNRELMILTLEQEHFKLETNCMFEICQDLLYEWEYWVHDWTTGIRVQLLSGNATLSISRSGMYHENSIAPSMVEALVGPEMLMAYLVSNTSLLH